MEIIFEILAYIVVFYIAINIPCLIILGIWSFVVEKALKKKYEIDKEKLIQSGFSEEEAERMLF